MNLHSFIQTISIAPLQVHYYLEALPTQHGYCARVSHRSATGNCVLGLAQGPCMVARAGFEPTTIRLKVIDSTNAPPRPTHTYTVSNCILNISLRYGTIEYIYTYVIAFQILGIFLARSLAIQIEDEKGY